jgi:hypothetical protein
MTPTDPSLADWLRAQPGGAERLAAARKRAKATASYERRIHRTRSPLSSRHRAGSRANRHRRTVPTFASDRKPA